MNSSSQSTTFVKNLYPQHKMCIFKAKQNQHAISYKNHLVKDANI